MEKYEALEMEILAFEGEDVITGSDPNDPTAGQYAGGNT